MLPTSMTPSETEKALRALFKKLHPPARAICHFPKPPQKHEVCGFSIYYKGALVREYYGKEMIKEFKKTAKEKGLACKKIGELYRYLALTYHYY